MTSDPAIDWRSPLLGFAAACLVVVALALIAPIQDKALIAGLGGATGVAAAVLAVLAKPPAAGSAAEAHHPVAEQPDRPVVG